MFEISTIQAVFIGIWAAIAISGTLLGNYTSTPLIYATGVGVILGDIQTGVIVGAAGQTLWLGFGVAQGGVRPPDPIAPGIFATVLAIVARHSQSEAALALAGPMTITEASVFITYSVPIGILMQLVITLLFTIMSPLSSLAQKVVEKEKYGLFRFYSNATMIVLVIVVFIFGFIVGFSANAVGNFAESLPVWLRNGFKVAGGMLPALGFALILKVMLKKEYLGFVFVGYFLAIVFDLVNRYTGTSFSVLALAITAFGIVLIIVSIGKLSGISDKIKQLEMQRAHAPAPAVGATQQGGEEDGI